MKPNAVTLFLALAAPTLAGCSGLSSYGDAEPGKPAVAAPVASGAATPNPQPLAPVASVQTQPLAPSLGASAGSTQSGSVGGGSPAQAAAPPIPSGAALGGVLGGPIGSSLTESDREAAWNAQLAALDSGESRSWRGVHGVFGFVAPGAETGGGCRAYSQTIYVAGRPNRGQGVACRQPGGTWKMKS
jgi:surface antigen